MSDVYVIETTYLASNGSVPAHLANFVTAAEYASVCYAVQEANDSATCASCCCEFAVCIFTGFFCIFCIHPCLQGLLVGSTLPS